MLSSESSLQRKFHEENVRLWQKLSSPRIPLADIDSVVYKWDLNLISQLVRKVDGKKVGEREMKTFEKNAFAKWIIDRKDTEVAQYLLLAKDCERVIESQNTLWYYYVEGDAQSTQLTEMARRNAPNYKGKRLTDRYALLRMRALLASKNYKECVELWEKQKNVFRPGALRDKAEGYAAGAYARTGKKDCARKIYARLHDYESYMSLSDAKTEMERFEICVNLWPNDEYTLSLLQQRINAVEKGKWHWWMETTPTKDYTELLKIVRKTFRRKDSRNSAAWNYAASFLEEKLGRKQSALSYLAKAQRGKVDTDLKDAMRVLADYIQVKYAKGYNDNLEKWLLGELTWMVNKAISNLNPQMHERLAKNVLWDVKAGLSVYYWDDMLRKIVLGQVVPLCIKSHYKVRALQYANMGENHLFCLLGKIDGVDIDEYRGSKKKYKDQDSTREYSANLGCNSLDYESDYFLNLDSLGIRSVERLIYRMQHPESPTDTFLSNYGYTDMQYLYDIAGTQMMASMRYREAVKYLSKVSASFQSTRNYESDWYTRYPFDPQRKKHQKKDVLYKLHFAQQMVSLERQMQNAKNPNDRAEAMLKYVAGLENSVTRCWPLTSYYNGYWSFYPMYSRNYTRRIDNIVGRSKRLKRKAFKMFTDKERAARAYCDFCMFKTAANRYPDTAAGRIVLGKCDVLKDYTALDGINYKRKWSCPE